MSGQSRQLNNSSASAKHTAMKWGILVAFVMVAVQFWLVPAKTQAGSITKYINFQGKLTNASGTNVTDGLYSMQFKIYDTLGTGSPPTGGILLWTETWDGVTNSSTQVQVTNGVFSVQLGTYVSLGTVDFTTKNAFLSVNFNPGAGYDGEMAPRKQLVASAFAFNANNTVGDGRIDIAYAPGDALNSAAKINYSPSVASTNAGLSVTSGSNVSGPALNVIQSGTGGGILVGSVALNGSSQTYLGANPGSFSGNFVDFQIANTSKFKIDSSGNTTVGGTLISGSHTLSANSSLIFSSGTGSIQFTGNAGTGGTTAGLIVKVDTSGNIITAAITDTNVAVGVATNTAALNSPVQVAAQGVVSVIADNTITAGDFIGIGTVTAGRAKSLGATYPTTASMQVLGRALGSAVAGGSFNLLLEGLDNSVSAGGGGASALSALTAATGITTLANANNAQTWNWGTLTTQTGMTYGGGTAMTTGALFNLNGGTYIHTSAETGTLLPLTFTDASTNVSGASITNGLQVTPTINTTGAGTKTINGIKIAAPTVSACTTGACTYNGLSVTGGSIANVTSTALTVDAGSGAGTNYAAAFLNGNVGIGTSAPAATLDLGSGNLYVGPSTGISSFSSAFLGISKNRVYSQNYVGATGSIGFFSGLEDNSLAPGKVLYAAGALSVYTGSGAASTKIQAGTASQCSNTGTGTINGCYGIDSEATVESGAGGVGNLVGLYGLVSNKAASTTTNAYGMYLSSNTNTGGGSITNNYGIYIGPETVGATTNYGIYQAGTANNYFGGNVGVGTSSPSALLSVGASNQLQVDSSGNIEQIGYHNTPFGGRGQFQNDLTYSEQFDNAAWVATNITVTANDATSNPAPDGQTTADKLLTTAAGGTIQQTYTTVVNGNYTFSVWLKTNSGTQPIQLEIDSTGATPLLGTATSFTATTTWQRFSVTQAFTGTPSNIKPKIIVTNNAATVVAWGGQLAAGTSSLAYIKTVATAATQVNRGAIANGDNSVFNGNVGIGTSTPANPLSSYSSTLPQGLFYGYTYDGNAAANTNGSVLLGNNSAAEGRIDFNSGGATTLNFDSTFDNSASLIQFRMRTAGTPVTAMAVQGTGGVGIGTATLIAGGGLTIAPALLTSGSPALLTLTGPADTGLTAATESSDVNFNLARTVQFAAGTLATQRAVLIQAPSYDFVSASTLTSASTVDITGAPKSQTNATLTNSYALNIEAGAVKPAGTVTNAYGLSVAMPTGATNNYAAFFQTGSAASGTFMGLKIGSTASQTITAGSVVTGLSVDLNTNYTASTGATLTGMQVQTTQDSNLNTAIKTGLSISSGNITQNTAATGTYTGISLTLPTLANTINAGILNAYGMQLSTATQTQTTTGTTSYNAINLSSAGALTQNTAAGTINWNGISLTLPAITATTGTITANGLQVTIPASAAITTAGTMNGISIVAPTTSGPAAGTLTGLNIANLTSAGSNLQQYGIYIGSGWNSSIAIPASTAGSLQQFTISNNATTPVQLLQIRDLTGNANTFGSLAIAGAFLSKQSYFGEEFNQFKGGAAGCSDTGTNGTVNSSQRRGDMGSPGTACTANSGEISTSSTGTGAGGTCVYTSNNAVNGYERIAATGTATLTDSCLESVGTATAGTNDNIFNTANLPQIIMKVRPSVTGNSANRVYLGMSNFATAKASLAAADKAVYFSNCSNPITPTCTGTAWVGYVQDGTTNPPNSVTCPGTISTAQFALLRIEMRKNTAGTGVEVQFFVVNDVTGGPVEQSCGTITVTTNTMGNTAMSMMLMASSASATAQNLDVDFYRVWQDDNAATGVADQTAPLSLDSAPFDARATLAKFMQSQDASVTAHTAYVDVSETDVARLVASSEIVAPKITANGLTIDKVDSLNSAITFASDTIFFGRPYFNTDSAGFAQIKQGQTHVDITFDNPYMEQPIVTANISLNRNAGYSGEVGGDYVTQSIVNDTFKFLVINKDVNGFSIFLSKPAPVNIQFSWIAIAVKSAKTFSMIGSTTAQPVAPNFVLPTPTPAMVSGVATNASSPQLPSEAVPGSAAAQNPAASAVVTPVETPVSSVDSNPARPASEPTQVPTPAAEPVATPAPATSTPVTPTPVPPTLASP